MSLYERGVENAAKALAHETSGGVPLDGIAVNEGHRLVARRVIDEFLSTASVVLPFRVESAFGGSLVQLWVTEVAAVTDGGPGRE